MMPRSKYMASQSFLGLNWPKSTSSPCGTHVAPHHYTIPHGTNELQHVTILGLYVKNQISI
jgi:hypothetical protein